MAYFKYRLNIQLLLQFLFFNFSFQEIQECSKDTPILKQNECILKYCTESEFINRNCIVNNNIIKTQWLNNIILIGDISYKYSYPYFDLDNNLIIATYPYDDNEESEIYRSRIFYGIQKNGRPLFYKKKTGFHSKKVYNLSYILPKKISEAISVKAFTIENENKYYNYTFLIGTSDEYTEMYKFDNTYFKRGGISSFFGEILSSKRFYIETSDYKNETLLAYIGYKSETYRLIFKGFHFYYNSSVKLMKYSYDSFKQVSNTGMCSCLRTQKNILGCFFVNSTNLFSFSIFNFIYGYIGSDKNPKLLATIIIDDTNRQGNIDLFYKCIHLKEEIIVFIYFNQENSFYLKINELIYSYKYDLKEIHSRKINNYDINSFYEYCDLIKINDNRFFFASSSNDKSILLLLIFDLFNSNRNVFIRKYNINLNLYNLEYYIGLRGLVFNNYIGLTFSSINKSIDYEKPITYFTLFGFINSTDLSSIENIFENDDTFSFMIGDYIYPNYIENNIFGYEFVGIKIVNISEIQNNGIIILDSLNRIINENDIISYKNNITLKKSDSGIPFGNYVFMFAGVVSEPKNYTELIKYSDDIISFTSNNNNIDYSSIYEPITLTGRIAYFNFSISSCYKTCSDCNNILGNNNNHFCSNCSDEYPKIYLNREKCLSSCDEMELYEYKNECINKCNNNTYVDLLTHICYDNCTENINTTRINTFQNTCVDICPEDYILIREINKCVEQIKDSESIYKEDIIEQTETNLINEETNTENLRTDTIKEADEFKKEKEDQRINEEGNYYELTKSQIIEDDNSNEIENSDLKNEKEKENEIEKEMNRNEKEIDMKEEEEKDKKEEKEENGNIFREEEKVKERDIEENEKEIKQENYNNENEEYIIKDQEVSDKMDENEEYVIKDQEVSDKMDKSDDIDFKENEKEINPTYIEEEKNLKTIGIKENEFTDIFSNKENKDNDCLYLYYFDIIKKEVICLPSNEKICPNEYPYKIKNINECRKYPLKYNYDWVSSCPEGTCIDTNISTLDICIDSNDNIVEIGGYCFYNKKNIISKIKNIYESENNKIEIGVNATLFIYSSKDDINELSIKYNNLTFIYLDICVNDLIKYYNYPDDTIFYVIGIDSPNKLSNTSINYYKYIVVDEKGDEIDIKNICMQSEIKISSPIINGELINYKIAYELHYQGYDIYIFNSNFYIDDCTPAHVNKKDVGFYNRSKDFYPENIEFCLENCTLEYTDYTLSRFICNCFIGEKKMVGVNQNYLALEDNFFKYLDDKVNYRIFKCFDLFIKYRNHLKDNFGFYLGIITLLIFIANLIYFSSKGISMLRLIASSSIKNIIINKKTFRKSINIFQQVKKNNVRKKRNAKTNYKSSPSKRKSKKLKSKKMNDLTIKKIQGRNKIKFNSNNLVKKSAYSIKNSNQKNIEISEERKFDLSENNMANLSISYDRNIYDINNKNKNNRKSKNKKSDINDKIDYNDLSYSKALLVDKRNLLSVIFHSFVLKINLIQIFCYPEEFTSKSITISIFLLSCLLELFFNSLLFTDEVVSKKYHNNGELELLTSLFLSIASNIISSIILFLIKKNTKYHLIFIRIEKEIKEEKNYLIALKNAFLLLKRNIIIFVIIGFCVIIISLYYISIFCIMYYYSQFSLLYNYFIGIIESLIVSIISAFIASILRIVGLNLKIRKIFVISRYIDDHF